MMDNNRHAGQNSEKVFSDEVATLHQEIAKLKKALEDRDWAATKTNEGVKALYRELERKNEELKKLDQLKSDFISMVSHELRTPLTVIRESVSQVAEGVLGKITQKQQEFLSICLEEIDRLKRIIDNLLDISKIEAGKVELKREWVDLVGLIEKVTFSFMSRAKAKGLELKTAYSDKVIESYIDRDKIIQIFNNLVGNALKFTDKGYIEIQVIDRESHIECFVADRGRGIADSDIPKLFSKFQQFGRTPGPGEKGTGLGLAISKNIVELHKGKIWVESQLGKGTKFIFTLPKYTPQRLLYDYINDALRQGSERGESLAVLCLSFAQDKVPKGNREMLSIMQNLERIIRDNLRHHEHAVTDRHMIFSVLSATERKDALRIMDRLKRLVYDYLLKKGIGKRIAVRDSIVSYPEDARTVEELFGKIEQFRVQGQMIRGSKDAEKNFNC